MLHSLGKVQKVFAGLGSTVHEDVIYAMLRLIDPAEMERSDFNKLMEQSECKREDGTVEVEKFIEWVFQSRQPGSTCYVEKNDLNGIADFVASVMEEWKSVDRSSIVAEDVSAYGGVQVYKVVSSGTPSVLCFKKCHRNKNEKGSDPVERCLRAGAAAAAAAGISPKRYVAGENWWCEEWGGMTLNEATDKGLFNQENLVDAAKLGDLLARFHSIDPKWYDNINIKDDILAQVRRRIPEQEQLDNFLWFVTRHPAWFPADIQDDGLRKWAQADFFLPKSTVGKRYVTIHGDFHLGNIVMAEDGAIRAIDFDFVTVHRAAFDIGYHIMHTHIWACKASRYAFVEAYLKTSGYPAEPENVADLLVDAEIYKLGLCLRTPLWDLLLRSSPRVQMQLADELWDAYKEFVSEVRSSTDLQKDVVELGLFKCIEKNSEKVTQLQRRVTARMVAVDSAYHEDVLSGKVPHWMAV